MTEYQGDPGDVDKSVLKDHFVDPNEKVNSHTNQKARDQEKDYNDREDHLNNHRYWNGIE